MDNRSGFAESHLSYAAKRQRTAGHPVRMASHQPRVARHALPWVISRHVFFNPERVESDGNLEMDPPPSGLMMMVLVFTQGSAGRATLGWRLESFQDSESAEGFSFG